MGSAAENCQSLWPSSVTSFTDYEVFVNFRGEDVRSTLIDVLRFFMEGAGIRYFFDNEEIDAGDKISDKLLRGIEKAHVYLVVLTPKYAESKWCRRELAYMVKCMKDETHGAKVIVPVFYGVTVEDVKMTSSYKTAMSACVEETSITQQEEKEWKDALRNVTRFKGLKFDISSGIIGISKMIVEELRDRLKMRHSSYHLVGAGKQARQLEEQLDIESDDVKFLVIYGDEGTGKTTLAREVFLQISHRFQGSSFLRDIPEMSKRYGFGYLKHKLLGDVCSDRDMTQEESCHERATIQKSCREKKVLIVLDDVDHWRQIEELAGSSTWFGPGSRILITSQRQLPESWFSNKPLPFRIRTLDENQQLKLFSRYAFGQDSPPLDYLKDVSSQIISHCEELPLVLEIMGSRLRRERDPDEWGKILKELENCKNVKEKLKISYDALSSDSVKSAFLDIACFFVNEEKTNPTYMWSTDRPEEGLAELRMSSLVKLVDGDKLWMHHYLRDIGRAMVAASSSLLHHQLCCLGRCRYWIYGEAEKVLKCEKDMKVEGVCLYDQQAKALKLKPETFSNKNKLRFLKLQPVKFKGDFKGKLNSLRWISWHKGPKVFKATKFASRSLVILDLAQSLIDDNWDGWEQIKGKSSLRVIDLTCCQNLTRMPDFSKFMNLERLILEDCSNLEYIGTSIGELKHLKCLNVKRCDSLKKLPKEIRSLKALKEILISKRRRGSFGHLQFAKSVLSGAT